MTFYPQLTSGAVVQFPYRATYRSRTIVNEALDGGMVRFEDWGGSSVFWRIDYSDLSEEEWLAIRGLHSAMEGRLRTFTFFDPSGNLAAWSDEMERDVWTKDPFLTVNAGFADPEGGTRARQLSNGSGVEQGLAQRISIPDRYQKAFSVWLRGSMGQTASLLHGSERKVVNLTEQWRRFDFCKSGAGPGEDTEVGLMISAGTTLQAYGAQVEAQLAPSTYKRTDGTGGVYQQTRFSADRIDAWSDGPGRFRTVVTLESSKGAR